MREFAAHGFEAASMNMICQDGGISKGNFQSGLRQASPWMYEKVR